MGIMATTLSTGLDYLAFPLSYGVKAFTGKTIGDYVTGNDRPPSRTGFVGNFVATAVDLAGPIALGMLNPVAGMVAMGAVVGTKALTGNSIGDYVTGNTDARRREAEAAGLMQEQAMVQQRMNSQQAGPAPMQSIPAPNIGASQAQMRAR